ncbi:unnamed protein product [Closterium sp. Yama58-4]|nr:unnamed protein product [Closterium sp. Yama58-4]
MALRLVSQPFHVVVLLLAAVASLMLSARLVEASITVGGYTAFSNGTVYDSSGKAVTPTKNADGSQTVGGYTLYSNGTITGPDGQVLYGTGADGSKKIGGTVVYPNGTYADSSGKLVQPVPNADGTASTIGDLTYYKNGTYVSTKGPVIVQPTDSIPKAASASPIKLGYIATAVTMAAGFAWLLA